MSFFMSYNWNLPWVIVVVIWNLPWVAILVMFGLDSGGIVEVSQTQNWVKVVVLTSIPSLIQEKIRMFSRICGKKGRAFSLPVI